MQRVSSNKEAHLILYRKMQTKLRNSRHSVAGWKWYWIFIWRMRAADFMQKCFYTWPYWLIGRASYNSAIDEERCLILAHIFKMSAVERKLYNLKTLLIFRIWHTNSGETRCSIFDTFDSKWSLLGLMITGVHDSISAIVSFACWYHNNKLYKGSMTNIVYDVHCLVFISFWTKLIFVRKPSLYSFLLLFFKLLQQQVMFSLSYDIFTLQHVLHSFWCTQTVGLLTTV